MGKNKWILGVGFSGFALRKAGAPYFGVKAFSGAILVNVQFNFILSSGESN